MKIARITAGGQLSVPAALRRRWGTSRVILEDEGDRLVVRPLPDDPIAAARGALKDRLERVETLRERARSEDGAATTHRS